MPSARMTAASMAAARTCFCRQIEANHTHQEGNRSAEGAQGSNQEGISDAHGLPLPRGTCPEFYSYDGTSNQSCMLDRAENVTPRGGGEKRNTSIHVRK